MQDFVENTDTGIPGIRNIPFIGEALSQRADLSKKTELVIFLRSTVIRDPSIEGDFRRYRDMVPGDNFFLKPNPQRDAPPTRPRDRL
jgi:general secretion pathway protein D